MRWVRYEKNPALNLALQERFAIEVGNSAPGESTEQIKMDLRSGLSRGEIKREGRVLRPQVQPVATLVGGLD